jgi:hypothetical protein
MANKIYPKWKEAIQQATSGSALNGSGTTGLYAALVDTGTYTYSDSHEFYSSISSAVVGTPMEIGSKTFTNGVLDGADVTFSAVTGNSVEAIVLFVKNAGANTTWRLVEYVDTSVTGLPVTPNGGDIGITWNASGIHAL